MIKEEGVGTNPAQEYELCVEGQGELSPVHPAIRPATVGAVAGGWSGPQYDCHFAFVGLLLHKTILRTNLAAGLG